MSNPNRQCPKCKAWWPRSVMFCVCGGRLIVPLAEAFDSVTDIFNGFTKQQKKTKGDRK